MKKKFFTAIVVVITMISCNRVEPLPEVFPEDGIITLVREISSPEQTRSGNSWIISATFDLQRNTVVEYFVSETVLATLGMSSKEFDLLVHEELGAYYESLSPVTTRSNSPHTECMEMCKDKYPKGEGRGGCKANCWVDTITRLIVELAEAVF